MKPPSLAPLYACLVPRLAEAAQGCGYALAVHGSMQRDLDLVAVPWIEQATDADTVVAAIEAACSGYRTGATATPEDKPHGRRAWLILLDGGCYIDLGVMPLRAEKGASHE